MRKNNKTQPITRGHYSMRGEELNPDRIISLKAEVVKSSFQNTSPDWSQGCKGIQYYCHQPKDIVLFWQAETKRIITGADILGRLLKGV